MATSTPVSPVRAGVPGARWRLRSTPIWSASLLTERKDPEFVSSHIPLFSHPDVVLDVIREAARSG